MLICSFRTGTGKSPEVSRLIKLYADERSHRSRVQFNLRNPRRFAETNAFRRNDVPWLTRDRLFASLMTIPPHSKQQNQFNTAKAGAMKNRRRTRFARDIFSYIYICMRIHTRVQKCVHSRSLFCLARVRRKCSRVPAHRTDTAKCMRSVHHTRASTNWRDGTLHLRHACRDTGCPSRSAADWRVQAVIGRLLLVRV